MAGHEAAGTRYNSATVIGADGAVVGQSISNSNIAPLFVKMAQNLDLRCVLISDPSTLGAGAKTLLESRIRKFMPHCITGRQHKLQLVDPDRASVLFRGVSGLCVPHLSVVVPNYPFAGHKPVCVVRVIETQYGVRLHPG